MIRLPNNPKFVRENFPAAHGLPDDELLGVATACAFELAYRATRDPDAPDGPVDGESVRRAWRDVLASITRLAISYSDTLKQEASPHV